MSDPSTDNHLHEASRTATPGGDLPGASGARTAESVEAVQGGEPASEERGRDPAGGRKDARLGDGRIAAPGGMGGEADA